MSDANGHTWARHAPYASFVWMSASAVWHIWMAIFPGSDVETAGPWGYTAFIIYDSLIILMSVAGAVLALATVSSWGQGLPRRLILFPLTVGCVLLIVRGGPGMIENFLVATQITPRGVVGVFDPSVPEMPAGEFWSTLAVNSFFFAGALFLAPTTRSYARRTRTAPAIHKGAHR
ncbi:hypothetical protein [Streptomyces iconiensis]|uniref:DUF3995 domain-containing protein n=1 Tax=Streptomyces iconiensis TaxID=1384038 RepID=A0ABT7A7N6_9ACTN|nr:hypothetical protein [Streptomyces iconiensis]MDJ1136856.1 hypothetical protein [Streptomyces iconiensis]